ncbi:MAG: AAA family ATPase [Herpetosiphon sp.]
MHGVWAIATNKGGIGKTTLTVNLGAALATRGLRILLIDLDKQGHAGLHLGRPRESVDRQASIVSVVEKQPIQSSIRPTAYPNFDLLPMHPDMVSLEPQLGNLKLYWLHRALQALPNDLYDQILIDTPPTGNLLTAALIAATRLVVPIIPEPLALEGLGDILVTVQDVRETLDAGPQQVYLVVNKWRKQTRLARSIRETLNELDLPVTILQSHIGIDISLPEASGAQQPVQYYRPNSRATREFSSLAAELHSLENDHE